MLMASAHIYSEEHASSFTRFISVMHRQNHIMRTFSAVFHYAKIREGREDRCIGEDSHERPTDEDRRGFSARVQIELLEET